ncbi:uncharacterized protein LOC143249799 [Tachypleus tridentatus]|uniref:uncharacterized protein LOC143249799 n=1 Tax=Tachypleus tridentatus TaxID=6853 RepID=UPI003FD6810C
MSRFILLILVLAGTVPLLEATFWPVTWVYSWWYPQPLIYNVQPNHGVRPQSYGSVPVKAVTSKSPSSSLDNAEAISKSGSLTKKSTPLSVVTEKSTPLSVVTENSKNVESESVSNSSVGIQLHTTLTVKKKEKSSMHFIPSEHQRTEEGENVTLEDVALDADNKENSSHRTTILETYTEQMSTNLSMEDTSTTFQTTSYPILNTGASTSQISGLQRLEFSGLGNAKYNDTVEVLKINHNTPNNTRTRAYSTGKQRPLLVESILTSNKMTNPISDAHLLKKKNNKIKSSSKERLFSLNSRVPYDGFDYFRYNSINN